MPGASIHPYNTCLANSQVYLDCYMSAYWVGSSRATQLKDEDGIIEKKLYALL